MTVTIVNYGVGNLRSVKNAFDFLGVASRIVSDPEQVSRSRRILLPGVGAFGRAMKFINERDMSAAITQAADSGALILGVCLGMQLLASVGEEGGTFPGLGLIEGRVIKLKPSSDLRVPHVGFNAVSTFSNHGGLFEKVDDRRDFYFLHSYHFVPSDPAAVIGTVEYGGRVTCAVRVGRVMGVQFHPEKSQQNGLQLLKNFAELS